MLKFVRSAILRLKSPASKGFASEPFVSEVRRSESRARLRLTGLVAACLCATFLFASPASATDFTLTASPLTEPAVAAGGTSASNITVTTGTGFSGPVTFACTVTPSVAGTVSNPVCTVSPASLSAAGGATATITTTPTTTAVSYTISISGTDASGTITATPLTLTVLAVTPSYTITVQNQIAPSSVPAGNGAEGIITITPLDGYTTPSTGGITLYCATITPLVTIPPICSFSYPTGETTLQITGTSPATSTITINTSGPEPCGTTTQAGNFPTRWLPLSLLGVAGLAWAGAGRRSHKAWPLLAMFVLGAALLLMPACGTSNGVCTTTPNGDTPTGSYTFTIVGVDGNGIASSNTGTGATGNTVSLTVTAPTPH
jgi:hypothetical protein